MRISKNIYKNFKDNVSLRCELNIFILKNLINEKTN
jgi:hypothetical protein